MLTANGAKDERAFLGFGTSDVFVDGLAAWFGLRVPTLPCLL